MMKTCSNTFDTQIQQNRILAVCLLIVLIVLTSNQAYALASNTADEEKAEQSTFLNTQKTPSSLFHSSSVHVVLSPELEFKPGKSLNQDNYAAKAEYWTEGKWGVSSNIRENQVGLYGVPDNSDFKRIDVNRKFLQAKDSCSFLAWGLGLQSLNIEDQIDSEGLNLSLLGEYTIGNRFSLFGNGTLFQGFDNDFDREVFGYQIEAGVNYQVGSNLSFSAGLKVSDLEQQQDFSGYRSFSSSFLIGTSLAF